MVPRAVLLVVCVGCGRIGFDPAVVGDGAAPDVLTCGSYGTWSAPVAVTELNDLTTDDLGAGLSPDGLTIYFHSFRPTGTGIGDIYTATRTTPAGTFGAVTEVAILNSTVGDRDPVVTRGGARVYYNSNRGTVDNIYYSDRVGAAFTVPVAVPELADGYGPWVADDELEAVISRNNDLVRFTRSSPQDPWIEDASLAIVNSSSNDGWPTLGADNRELIFESTRSGTNQLWVARRGGRGQPFSAPVAIDELNTAGNQSDPDLSANGRTLYFSSDRNSGQDDIYIATRTCD